MHFKFVFSYYALNLLTSVGTMCDSMENLHNKKGNVNIYQKTANKVSYSFCHILHFARFLWQSTLFCLCEYLKISTSIVATNKQKHALKTTQWIVFEKRHPNATKNWFELLETKSFPWKGFIFSSRFFTCKDVERLLFSKNKGCQCWSRSD